MEFTTLPPEVISALIHSGPGSESLANAAAAWRQLGADLEDAADNYAAAVSSMSDTWHGPSAAAMSSSAAPFLTWLRTTSQQAQQVAASAQAAAVAFNSASAVGGPDGASARQPDAAGPAARHQRLRQEPPGDRRNRGRLPDHVGEQRGGDDPLSGRLDAGRQPAAVHLARLDHQPVGAGLPDQCADRRRDQLGKLDRGEGRRGRHPGAAPYPPPATPTSASSVWRTPTPTSSSRPDSRSTCSATWRRASRRRHCKA